MVSPVDEVVVHLWRAAAGPLPTAAGLPGHVIFLYESPADGRPDKLGGSDRHSIELAQACDQSRKSQGPVGLLWVN